MINFIETLINFFETMIIFRYQHLGLLPEHDHHAYPLELIEQLIIVAVATQDRQNKNKNKNESRNGGNGGAVRAVQYPGIKAGTRIFQNLYHRHLSQEYSVLVVRCVKTSLKTSFPAAGASPVVWNEAVPRKSFTLSHMRCFTTSTTLMFLRCFSLYSRFSNTDVLGCPSRFLDVSLLSLLSLFSQTAGVLVQSIAKDNSDSGKDCPPDPVDPTLFMQTLIVLNTFATTTSTALRHYTQGNKKNNRKNNNNNNNNNPPTTSIHALSTLASNVVNPVRCYVSRSTLSLLNLAEQIRRVHSVAMQVRHSRRTVVCGTVVCGTVGGTRDVPSSTGPTMKRHGWMVG